MLMNEYQAEAHATAIYSEEIADIYPLLGLAGEVGELLNKAKKVLRDGVEMDRVDLVHELGDILWYLAVYAEEQGISLEIIAQANLQKLHNRKKRGVLQGSGDNR